MLYQLSYASPKPPGNLSRKPTENVGTLPLHADHGTELKISILKPVEQTCAERSGGCFLRHFGLAGERPQGIFAITENLPV
jgi:hypothetical protein